MQDLDTPKYLYHETNAYMPKSSNEAVSDCVFYTGRVKQIAPILFVRSVRERERRKLLKLWTFAAQVVIVLS